MAWLLAAGFLLPGSALQALTITEVFYHPAAGSENLEFIELFNETADPIDLTGYYFSRGVDFVITERTFLDGRSFLVVCANAQAVRETYGIENVIGDWNPETALANGGETIELMTSTHVVAARVTYNDRGKWPAGADGTGHSLAMIDPYLRPGTSASWALSGVLGGSPGAPNDTALGALPLTINEISVAIPEDPGWIELYNSGDEPIDLAAFHVSRDRDQLTASVLDAGVVAPPRGWLVLTPEMMGFDLAVTEESPRLYVVLSQPGGDRVVDAASVMSAGPGTTVARVADGGRGFEPAAEPTPGEANRTGASTAIVISEIHYHPLDNNPDSEFVELFNKGPDTVGLGGWQFVDGIDFEFPEDVSIPAGEWLVVARDPVLIRERYGLGTAAVVGATSEETRDSFGVLADGGERLTLVDEQGNTVDTVRYQDGGEWPVWTDGEGSSLELIDPEQDNAIGQAWDASDDSDKAEVVQIGYQGISRSGESELHLTLGDSGMALVDEISMRERTVGLANEQVIFDFPSTWRFFRGRSAPSDSPDAWAAPEFDDSDWETGQAVFGYGAREADEVTVLDDMRGVYLSAFFRQEFEIDAAAAEEDMILTVEYDDGFAAFINGQLVAEDNLPDGRAFDIDAGRTRSRTADFRIEASDLPIVPGRNVVAIQVHNSSANNVDFRFAARCAIGTLEPRFGENLVVDGTFETPDEEIPIWPRGSRSPNWRIQGTHVRSGRVEEGALAGSASLKIVATGKGDNKVNRIETTNTGLGRVSSGLEIEVGLLARWIVGSPVLMTRGTYSGSAPAAYAKSHILPVPARLGSPGGENSVTRRLAEAEGAANLGPLIWSVHHEPAVPNENEPVTVSARVGDSDGVQDVLLHYSLERPYAAGAPELVSLPMEGPDAVGGYQAVIPGQEFEMPVVFFITATDTMGASGRFPLDHLKRSHPLIKDVSVAAPEDDRHIVYIPQDVSQTGTRGEDRLSYRFWIHKADEAYLASRILLSNDLVDSTMVFEERDLYYNTKIRFSGSPFARQRWGESYRVRMPKDQPLFGRIQKFGLEDHQGAGGLDARERISSYMIRYNQGDTTVPFGEAFLARINVNRRVINGVREHLEVPSREYLSRWFPGDSDGPFFEMDDRHVIDDSGGRSHSQDGRLLAPPYAGGGDPDDKENYRFYFTPRGKNTTDDFDELIAFAKLMTPSATTNEEFAEQVWDRVNVEEFLRIWSIRLNTDDWDTWGARRGKNCYLYMPPEDGRWVLLPWDMELTYGDPLAFRLPNLTDAGRARISSQFAEVSRMLNDPEIQRLYYAINFEMTKAPFHSEFLEPYMERLARLGMAQVSIGRRNGFIDRRRGLLLRATERVVSGALDLEILTNLGFDMSTADEAFTIEGHAPVDLRRLVVVINGVEMPEMRPSFQNAVSWTLSGALQPGRNEIVLLGLDVDDEMVASDSIVITRVDGPGFASFVRGDTNLNGRIEIRDAIWTFLYLQGSVSPLCLDALDVDDDGTIGVTDIVRGLDFLFRGGEAPLAPFPAAGPDPTEDDLGCHVGAVESVPEG